MAAATPVIGTNAHFVFNGVDLSGDGNQIKLTVSQDTHDVSEFGNAGWKLFIAGLASAEITFGAYYDDAAGQIAATIWAAGNLGAPTASRTFEVDPVNNTAGGTFYKYTGNCWASKFDLDSKVNAAVTANMTLRVTGAVVRAVIP